MLVSMLMIVYLIFSGSECNELTNQQPVPDALVGNWKLSLQTGALQDICPDETVNFQSSGIALLTCPNSQQVSREYSVSNNILNYTQTSIAYDVVFSNNQQTLELNGRNVSRNLTYIRQSAADAIFSNSNSAVSNHSSEKPKEELK